MRREPTLRRHPRSPQCRRPGDRIALSSAFAAPKAPIVLDGVHRAERARVWPLERGRSRWMSPRQSHSPIVTADVALRDVEAAVEHVLRRRGVPRLNLLGWSWGATLVAAYTTQNNDKVNRLVLYAPQWVSSTAAAPSATPLGASFDMDPRGCEKTPRGRRTRGQAEGAVSGRLVPDVGGGSARDRSLRARLRPPRTSR